MVSAACPKCTVYLMEAGGQISDFEKAEAEAVTLGATILSNSWICYGYGDCGDSNFSRHFDTKGIACVAASSDGAYDQIDARSVLDSASDGRYKKYYSGPGGWGTPNGIRGY